jgi:hypothetical protein
MNAEKLKTAEELLAEAEASLKEPVEFLERAQSVKRFGTPLEELDDPRRVKGKFVLVNLYDQKRKISVTREGHVREVVDVADEKTGALVERRVVISVHNGHASLDTSVELDFFDKSWRFRYP